MLARVVLHGIPGEGGVHVVIPDVGVGRVDGVKELLVIIHLHFPGRSLILDGREGGLQNAGVAAVGRVIQLIGTVRIHQLSIVTVET